MGDDVLKKFVIMVLWRVMFVLFICVDLNVCCSFWYGVARNSLAVSMLFCGCVVVSWFMNLYWDYMNLFVDVDV